jgi:hypothetical protein
MSEEHGSTGSARQRLVSGLGAGAALGVPLALVGPIFLGQTLRVDPPFFVRAAAGFLVGTALAGALLGVLRPRMRGWGASLGAGILAAAVGVGCVRLAVAAWVPLSAASVFVPLGVAVLIGTFAGLLGRGASGVESEREGTSPAAEWVHRLAEWSRQPSARRTRRRQEVIERPFPPEWIPVLEHALPAYRRMADEERGRLHGRILVFLDEKSFEGCGGLEMTDEIRVTVAAQACLLSLNLEGDSYADLRSILIYPSTYVAQPHARDGEIAEAESVRLGESWVHGTVVLAWDSVRRGASVPNDGQNVVMHEFAHQLDQEDGASDGVPFLRSASCYSAWSRVLGRDFAAHRARSEAGRARVLDEYGATNPAEFFAVATETFFEKPRHLERSFPELYQELAAFYGQDPARWPAH